MKSVFLNKINTLSVVILWLPTFWSSKILWPPYFSFQKFMTPSIFGTPLPSEENAIPLNCYKILCETNSSVGPYFILAVILSFPAFSKIKLQLTRLDSEFCVGSKANVILLTWFVVTGLFILELLFYFLLYIWISMVIVIKQAFEAQDG